MRCHIHAGVRTQFLTAEYASRDKTTAILCSKQQIILNVEIPVDQQHAARTAAGHVEKTLTNVEAAGAMVDREASAMTNYGAEFTRNFGDCSGPIERRRHTNS